MSSGYASKAGVKFGVVWGSAWAAVDTVIPFASESLTRQFDKLQSKALIGRAAEHVFSNGIELTTGELVIEMTEGLGMDLITQGMGSRSVAKIILANDLSGNVFNLEIDKGHRRWRFGSCMVNTVKIAGEMGSEDPVQITLGLVVRNVTITSTAFPSISLSATNAARVYPEDFRGLGYFRVGDLADTLDVVDDIPVSGFELNVDNKFKMDDKDSKEIYVVQPERDDFRTVTAKFNFNRYKAFATNFETWKAAGTPIQALFVTPAPKPYFSFPHCKIESGADFNIGGPGVITDEVTLNAYYNGSGGAAVNSYSSTVDQFLLNFPALT